MGVKEIDRERDKEIEKDRESEILSQSVWEGHGHDILISLDFGVYDMTFEGKMRKFSDEFSIKLV